MGAHDMRSTKRGADPEENASTAALFQRHFELQQVGSSLFYQPVYYVAIKESSCFDSNLFMILTLIDDVDGSVAQHFFWTQILESTALMIYSCVGFLLILVVVYAMRFS